MFVYEDGMPMAYDHTDNNYACRNGCTAPVLHAAVEDAMVAWMNKMPATTRVRAGKVAMMYGETVDIKRLANE